MPIKVQRAKQTATVSADQYNVGDLAVYKDEKMVHEVIGFENDWKGVKRCLVRMTDSGNVYPFYMTQWRLATKEEIKKYRKAANV